MVGGSWGFAVSSLRLVVGGWWLVVGGWWLVVGGWWLVRAGVRNRMSSCGVTIRRTLSRRDLMKVAWHEVPGKRAMSEPSR